ncbi:MAG: hypothetical protein ACE5OZ_00120 [Candidatus Heimdallarchaeota archaeon]
MPDISVILYDSLLQPVSEFSNDFLRHKAIQNDAAREGYPAEQLIIDLARHYPAIQMLQSSTHGKIGRPDIAHVSLLTLLHHPIMKKNPVQAYIHTIGGRWFSIPPDWRIPVNYIRFIGLMRQLFSSKRVPTVGDAILELNQGNLAELIDNEALQHRKLLLSRSGSQIAANDLAERISETGAVLMIGGFQMGTPSKMALDIADEIWSISPHELTAWTTISMLMTALLD